LMNQIDGVSANAGELADFERVRILLTRMSGAGLETLARIEDILNANEVLLFDIAATLLTESQNKPIVSQQQQWQHQAQQEKLGIETGSEIANSEESKLGKRGQGSFMDWAMNVFICGK
jgi:hypothetical protein